MFVCHKDGFENYRIIAGILNSHACGSPLYPLMYSANDTASNRLNCL